MPTRTGRKLSYLITLAVVLAAAISISAVGGAAARSRQVTASAKSASGGIITFAEQPGEPPTYIFPLYDGANSGNNNITYLQPLMWKPLYWFGHTQSSLPTINYTYSMADPPVFSDGGKTVTMTLKHYMWSDGKPVTSRDLTFWMNLLLAEKTNYSSYVPGGFLDHITSVSAPNPSTFVIHMNKAFSSDYLIYNGLSLLSPIPQQTWDKESATGPIGNYDETPAGAKKVYDFLNKESLSLSTWATDPIWQTVDGPWHLAPKTGFQVTGQVLMDANPKYSGPDKPKVAQFEELPFTSGAAEFNALQAGTVDYGYVPTTDIAGMGSLKASGFKIDPYYEWGITFIQLNFSNPKYAPLLGQLYIRQAMETLIDQPAYIKYILQGYGQPTYGPVPVFPSSSFLDPATKQAPYPYSVSKAKALLTSHGWKVPSSGVATCAHAGSGAADCGAGIAAGTELSLPLIYPTGFPALSSELQATKSAYRKVGIDLSLDEAPEGTVLSDTYECTGKTVAQCPANSTALSLISSPLYTYVPTYYPDGDTLFACGGATNGGNYCDKQTDTYISELLGAKTSSQAVFDSYQQYIAKQVPVLWFPNSAYQISAISPKLSGVDAQDSTAHIYPQTWSLK
jgi:peptide/nickel transport system substrate-binding protein